MRKLEWELSKYLESMVAGLEHFKSRVWRGFHHDVTRCSVDALQATRDGRAARLGLWTNGCPRLLPAGMASTCQ